MDPFLTSRIVTDVLGGLTNGVIFGMVALSLVLIWRSTGVLNFAQGAMPMFATYVASRCCRTTSATGRASWPASSLAY